MPDDAAPRPSADPVTARIAERVRALREAVGWTQAELADAVAEFGLPWKRATVVNLEKRTRAGRGAGGGRDSVSVQELLALALVFDVPPVMLIADPRSPDPVPVAAGDDAQLDPWVALSWLVGDTKVTDRFKLGNWRRESWLIWAGHDVSDAIADLEREDREQRHREALEKMSKALLRIDAAGAHLPPLPDHVFTRARELGIELLGQDA